MKYEEIVSRVKEIFEKADVSEYKNHLAIQFNITGEGEGAFYVELTDGKAYVEPYEYYDRDIIVTLTADELFSLISGKLDCIDSQIEVSNTDSANEVKKVLALVNTKKVESDTQLEITEVSEPVVETTPTAPAVEEPKTETAVTKETVKEPTKKSTTTKKTTAKKSTTKKSTTAKKTTTKKSTETK